MSYVPPHLRNSAATTTTTIINGTGDHLYSKQLNNSSFQLSSGRSNSTLDNNNNGHSWNAGNRTSGNYISPRTVVVPDTVFPQWKPSERVIRLKPEQIEEVRLRLNVDVTVSPNSLPAPAPIESFVDMNLCESIMKDIAFHGYTTPTSIQAQAMPVALSGRDLLGCAETGSGKTAAFTIPMIQHCLAQPPVRRGDGPLALVLAPTRELAQQIEKEVKAFGRSLDSFKTAIVVGGTNISEQRSELRAWADRMLDMGFELQIREVMQNLPEKHQTLLFSATMPVEIEELAQLVVQRRNVSQILEKVPENEKIDRLLDMLVEEAAQSERSGFDFPLTIVFVERKTRCDEVAEALIDQGLQAAALHGGRSQSERETALRDFRHGPTKILVATDVASRGLDVTGVAHVINLDLPKTMEDYVHRIGRTGRAGSTGRATSFCADRDMYLVAQIKKAIADVDSGSNLTFATWKDCSKEGEGSFCCSEGSKDCNVQGLGDGTYSNKCGGQV
ncbi:ATP-dependent RNA helicase DBP2 [Forsythia ovata]|uniref:RNA helicase n=1 Tax=Forsythia ovata TaxID=205694 RepID=A0ABD1RKN2_9LAMI